MELSNRGQVTSSPAVTPNGTVYVGSWDYGIYAIQPTGALEWRFWANYPVSSSPVVGATGTIYVGSRG